MSQSIKSLPSKGKVMSIDVGTKRIGVASCDETRSISSPKFIINRQSNLKDFEVIKKFAYENSISAIVVGLPFTMDGGESEMSKFARNFAKNLENFLENKIPIFLFDERLTSFEAREFNASKLSRKNKNKKFCDDIAASIILESFLESLKHEPS